MDIASAAPSASARASAPFPRALAPDVARGAALLGIAIVNAGMLAPHDLADTADRTVAGIVTLFLENRSWPMFALLFGFGIAAIAGKLERQGLPARRRGGILVRRNLWLVAFGALQVVLVFWGDILAVYGITGMLVVALLRSSPRTLWIMGSLSATLWFLGTTAAAVLGGEDVVPSSFDYVTSIVERLGTFVYWTGTNSILLTHLAPMLIGVALFRIGALHRPTEHRGLLRRLAFAGVAAGVLGAIPQCLIVVGVWTPDATVAALALGVHALTGVAGGVGYVAAIGLWAASRRPDGEPRGLAWWLVAAGRRPLTVYLTHSILLGLSLSAWALDLAPRLSAAGTWLFGVGVGVVCILVAAGLAAARLPGPADALLRRLTYGSLTRQTPVLA